MDGRSEGGWTSVSQSISQQTDCQFAEQWASRGSRPAEGRRDAQGQVLLVLMLNCSDAHAGRQENG